MRRCFFGMMLLLAGVVVGEEKFEVTEFSIDMNQYRRLNSVMVYPGPNLVDFSLGRSDDHARYSYPVYRKSGTNIIEIYSLVRKIATLSVPFDLEENTSIIFSQTFVDADDRWEYLVSYNTGVTHSTLYDDDGTVLLTYNYASPSMGFDGSSTYLFFYERLYPSNEEYIEKYVSYRLRSNITAPTIPALAKKTSAPQPMMLFGTSGNYNIALQPAGAGKTSVQLFDFMGRVVFNKTIDNVTAPVTFSIPANELPRTPFVAKVNNGDVNAVRKEIPVR